MRDPGKKKFYLIATDLRIESGCGWEKAQYEGSRDLIVWESEDLVHWSEERACTVGIPEAGCVWAPEAVYDSGKEEFLVFWASMVKAPADEEAKQRIYASWTKDFRQFSEPFVYMEREQHVIDSTIVENQGRYYRFTKDETNKCIILEESESLTGTFRQIPSETLSGLLGVEGPECYLLPDGNTWCLIVDQFAEEKGYLPVFTKDLGSGVLEIAQEGSYDLGTTKKRHGGVLVLEDEEYERLERYFDREYPVIEGLYADPDLISVNGPRMVLRTGPDRSSPYFPQTMERNSPVRLRCWILRRDRYRGRSEVPGHHVWLRKTENFTSISAEREKTEFPVSEPQLRNTRRDRSLQCRSRC